MEKLNVIIKEERSKYEFFENEPSENKGKLLAKGTGIRSMGETSFKYGFSNKNTVLHVDNPDDLNSKWKIYERIGVKNVDTRGWHIKK